MNTIYNKAPHLCREVVQLKMMLSQKAMRWLSKNFELQGVVVFQG